MQEGLKRILQDFSGVERTSVQFSIPAIVRERSGWNNNGVCSSNGTFVTVTFESVSLEVCLLHLKKLRDSSGTGDTLQ